MGHLHFRFGQVDSFVEHFNGFIQITSEITQNVVRLRLAKQAFHLYSIFFPSGLILSTANSLKGLWEEPPQELAMMMSKLREVVTKPKQLGQLINSLPLDSFTGGSGG